MNIRAKMRCELVAKQGDTEQVRFGAVYSEDKTSENYSFSQATPAANFNINISNPSAQGVFVEGREYYFDISPASVERAQKP